MAEGILRDDESARGYRRRPALQAEFDQAAERLRREDPRRRLGRSSSTTTGLVVTDFNLIPGQQNTLFLNGVSAATAPSSSRWAVPAAFPGVQTRHFAHVSIDHSPTAEVVQ